MTDTHCEVRFTPAAEDDLVRLADFLLDRAQDMSELNQVEAAMRTLRQVIEKQLSKIPWAFRKAGQGRRTTRREMVVPGGASGYVALYEIESKSRVQVLAVRHQLEQDYH
ncbi:MAG: type II toxin-antitoxin system RelE/ParE family toxin [Proteobacteria bacterium]|nr:type II toxin-antitoxin system RelE/ParE family toxin [Pseudomonadota bacterium]